MHETLEYIEPQKTSILLTSHEIKLLVNYLLSPPEDVGENNMAMTEILAALIEAAGRKPAA